ncbi:aminotransferase [Pelagibius sp.]|uniref:aminotransferase n=1 Tax=Pelagibius sp. TaxID=1931238 RepID=UPI003BB18C52
MNGTGNSQAALDIAYQVHPQTNLRLHDTRGPMIIERAEGAFVYDDGGQRYLDAMSGLWCVSLGYSDQALKDAVKAQIDELPYFQLFAHRSNNPSIDLAALLIEKAPVPMSKVIFQCSGSEANDTAVKLAWYYWNSRGKPEKKKILALNRAYHGTGISSGSLTGLVNIHSQFDLPLPGFLHTRCPHHYREGLEGESEEDFVARLAQELEQLIVEEGPDTVAAFFAEPVMGTGGVVVPPEGYFAAVQKVLQRHEILLIADEVICGFGRTGEYWGSTKFGIRPDMLTCAKSLSSAYLPVSAVMVSESIFEAMVEQSDRVGVFGHGYTYGGHPVCAAAAIAAITRYEELDVVHKARAMGQLLQDGLRQFVDHPLVGEVRGVGMMAGIELVQDKATKAAFDPKRLVGGACSAFIQDRGVISRNLIDTMAFSPPLIVSESEIDMILEAVAGGLDDTLAWAKKEGLK